MGASMSRRLNALEQHLAGLPPHGPLASWTDRELAAVVGVPLGLTADEVLALPDEALQRVAAGGEP